MSDSTENKKQGGSKADFPSWMSGEQFFLSDPELRRRYRVQMVIGVSLIITDLLYLSSIIFYFESYLWSLAFFFVPAFGAILMVFLYRTGNVNLVGHGTCLLVLLGIGIPNFVTGGASGANAASMLILPVTALIVLDRWALIWVGASILLILGFQTLDLMGYDFPQVIPPESQPIDTTITLIISSIVIPGVLWFSEVARRRAESSLVEIKEKAESANRAKGQFLANMSHEFRTPLNGIMGLAELILNGKLEPKLRHQMDMVKNSANTILTLVDDILDFSKVEENKLELLHEKFNIRAKLLEILEILKVRAAQKGLTVSWEVAEEVPSYLVGDPRRFSQVVTNIVANAIKFTERGSVKVTVEEGQRVDDDLELLVKVMDTGIGILPERRIAIFDAFTQADGSTTRRFGGSGLGLAISNRLVGLMGGAISVDSEPGHGSVFTFTAWFSCTQSLSGEFSRRLSPTAVQDAPIVRSAVQLSVLLAEDNEINRQMMKSTIEKMGHKVDVVFNGKAAVDRLEHAQYDLVLMDVQMPVMDGLDASRLIRERDSHHGCHTLIVAMTAHAMPGDRQMCLDAGMDDYISKPVSIKELTRILEGACESPGQGSVQHKDETDSEDLKILDFDELLSRTRGDMELVKELLGIFRQSSSDLFSEMKRCLTEQDIPGVGRAAHSLKGAASMMGAKRLLGAARQIELNCRQSETTRIADEVDKLGVAIDELHSSLDEAQQRIASS